MSDLVLPDISDADLAAYDKSQESKEAGAYPAQFNYIKIDQDVESELFGNYTLFKQGETEGTVLGSSFKATIIKKMNRYLFFSDEPTERMHTSQFELWEDLVNVYVGGVLKDDNVSGIASYMKEHFPERKYNALLYVMYKGDAYLLKITPGSCSNLFEYEKSRPRSQTSYKVETNFGLIKEKTGNTPYFAVTFEKGKEHKDKDYSDMMKASFAVHDLLDKGAYEYTSDTPVLMSSETDAEKELKEVFDL